MNTLLRSTLLRCTLLRNTAAHFSVVRLSDCEGMTTIQRSALYGLRTGRQLCTPLEIAANVAEWDRVLCEWLKRARSLRFLGRDGADGGPAHSGRLTKANWATNLTTNSSGHWFLFRVSTSVQWPECNPLSGGAHNGHQWIWTASILLHTVLYAQIWISVALDREFGGSTSRFSSTKLV